MTQGTETAEIKQIIEGLLTAMNIPYESVTPLYADGRVVFMISTRDAKSIIGAQGSNLNAIYTLVRQIVYRRLGYNSPFSIDANYYQQRQREALVQKARTIADRARSFRSKVAMNPMPSYERFVIHQALGDMADIETYSEGSGIDRRVIVQFKNVQS